eukprot:CAMPEP_0198266562 /NCGR_PEP_ID=MMETSP1447-20131203/28898_1 /TAXON_ID=420782 /ORGANISM="Chaetoceros dichaeta, Strain CCMP1751" /LENGTH=534 /DNA_ID=CAMNT_0043956703 /DNA_START=199 /DNA_END=1804 /DNA_ORIENTATION=+
MEAAPSQSIVDKNAPTDERTPEEEAFFQNTKILCSQRNINFKSIKNARDLATVRNSPIKPNRVLRTGRVSDATDQDLKLLYGKISTTKTNDTDESGSGSRGIRTLVDLRSPTELKDDLELEREDVYGDFANLIWSERKGGLVRELNGSEPRISPSRRKSSVSASGATSEKERGSGKRNILRHVKDIVRLGLGKGKKSNAGEDSEGASVNTMNDQVIFLTAAADLAAVISETNEADLIVQEPQSKQDSILFLEEDEDGGDEIEDCCGEETLASMTTSSSSNCRFIREFPPGTMSLPATSSSRGSRKERHFVSLMNELKYVRGTLSKLRKRDIVRVLVQSPGAILSRRVRANCKDVFLSEINEGGLPMLNELILKMGSSGIKYVLELCADTNRHPVAFYCTAGKDRTGIIAVLILSVLGVPEEDIVEDYSLSANVYAEMNDHKAMVGALNQRNVNPKTFLGAPPQVMKDTLETIQRNYGNVDGYLDSIGFGLEHREKLKNASCRSSCINIQALGTGEDNDHYGDENITRDIQRKDI